MKRIFACFLALWLCLFSFTPVEASSSYVKKMTINCVIDQSGTATFTEVWDMYAYQGTEVYKQFDNMHDQKLTLVSVTDNKNVTYKNVGTWNVDQSRSYKKNKCGLIDDNGDYQLCFGVGDYGHRTFTMVYKISHFVNQYKENQGINYAFMSNMELEVQSVDVNVSSPALSFTKDNSGIWAFGFEGNCDFLTNGHVHLYTTQSVSGGKVQLLMKLNSFQYTSPSTYHQSEKFSDVLDDAREGSSYNENDSYQSKSTLKDTLDVIVPSLIFVLVIVVWALSFVVKRGNSSLTSDGGPMKFEDGVSFDKKNVHSFQDIPCDKDLLYFYYLAKRCGILNKGRSGLMSAFVLKWLRDGSIRFDRGEDKGLIFKHETYTVDFSKPINCSSASEEKLVAMFKRAAGENQLLETKEFEHWCKRNYDDVEDWFDEVDTYTEAWMKAQDYYKEETTYRRIFGLDFPKTKKFYTVKTREDMEHVYGLYKFLKDQDNMKDKQVLEVKLWEEYLIFATIMGIADEVEKQLPIACPEFNRTSDIDVYQTSWVTRNFIYAGVMSADNAYNAANGSSSWGGGGGGASFGGGGGGFSGGGGGGLR